MILSFNFWCYCPIFGYVCPNSHATVRFRLLLTNFGRYPLAILFWTSFIDLISDIIVRFQTSLSEFEHSCAILNTIFRFWTLLSVFVHHRAMFDAMSSDFGHCIPILSIIALFRHFCPILDIMFWFRTLLLVFGHNVPKFGHYWLITNSIVRIRAPLSELRYCCTNLNTIARFRSLMSVFKYRCPILDTIVRFRTLSSDFGHFSPILDTVIRFWTLSWSIAWLWKLVSELDTTDRF